MSIEFQQESTYYTPLIPLNELIQVDKGETNTGLNRDVLQKQQVKQNTIFKNNPKTEKVIQETEYEMKGLELQQKIITKEEYEEFKKKYNGIKIPYTDGLRTYLKNGFIVLSVFGLTGLGLASLGYAYSELYFFATKDGNENQGKYYVYYNK